MITFLKTHKLALFFEFIIVSLAITSLLIADTYWLHLNAEQTGMTLLVAALPWSYLIMFRVGSGLYNMVVISVGIGFNVVIVTTILGSVVSWWRKLPKE